MIKTMRLSKSRKILQKFKFGGLILVLGLFLLSSTNLTLALEESELYEYGQNEIVLYDASDNCFLPSSAKEVAAAASFGGLSAVQVGFVEAYHDIAVKHSINYGIPWEAVMAQGILESASGTSRFARTRNNFFGIGAFDSNPGNAHSYDTPEEGWEGYYKNIVKTATYRNHGVFAGDTVTDPYAYIRAIKDAGYATDPNYVDKLSKLVAQIETLAVDRDWPSSASLAAQFPEWSQNAELNRQGAGGDNAEAASNITACGADAGELVSGGMTLEEAEAFMEFYAQESDKFARGTVNFDGATITDSGCPSGTLNNCSAFTQWFMNRYTTLGPNGVNIAQGSRAVQRYLGAFPELIDGGKVPRAYAVVSMGPYTGNAAGWPNHTGIVLGIDQVNDQIIIGEASCGSRNGARYYRPRAKAYSLAKYTENPSAYGPTYAYTDNVINIEGARVNATE